MKHFLLAIGLISLLFSCKSSGASSSNGKEGVNVEINEKYDYLITFHTGYGDIQAVLFDDTPEHKKNFIKLAMEGYYDSTTFHRVIDGFMIQGGDPNSKDDDPNNDGRGGPEYTIPAEIQHKHVYGALAGARMPDFINPKRESSGSQFYIVENKEGTPFLDGAYTVFGQVISGMKVVEAIAEAETGANDRPSENIYMTVTAEKMKRKKLEKLKASLTTQE